MVSGDSAGDRPLLLSPLFATRGVKAQRRELGDTAVLRQDLAAAPYAFWRSVC